MNRRKQRDQWSNSSKRHSRCPMCKKSFDDCPYSVVQVDNWLETQVIKKEVAYALSKMRKQ